LELVTSRLRLKISSRTFSPDLERSRKDPGETERKETHRDTMLPANRPPDARIFASNDRQTEHWPRLPSLKDATTLRSASDRTLQHSTGPSATGTTGWSRDSRPPVHAATTQPPSLVAHGANFEEDSSSRCPGDLRRRGLDIDRQKENEMRERVRKARTLMGKNSMSRWLEAKECFRG
jgi:hypothetical protein